MNNMKKNLGKMQMKLDIFSKEYEHKRCNMPKEFSKKFATERKIRKIRLML